MTRVVLHVGLPKTGTTSIQDFLAAQAGPLADTGVLFPIVREDLRTAGRAQGIGVGWHRALSMFVSGRPDALAPGEWEAWQAEFRRFDQDPALRTLLLSQEGLIGAGRGDRVAALMAELPAGARRIVLVLRPADAWLTSLYEQFVRSIVRTAEEPGAFSHALAYAERGYQGMIRRIEAQVPGAEMHLLSFDDLVAGEGLLTNFARALDLPEWLGERATAAPRANPGLPQDMVAFLRRVNEARVPHAAFVAIRGALARAARRRTGARRRGQIFPPELAGRIAARYEQDRAYVHRRFGLDLRPMSASATYTPLDCDPVALRQECAPFLHDEALAAWDHVQGLSA